MADPEQLGWTDISFAVVLSTAEDVENILHSGPDLAAKDFWERTPWLLAIQTGSVEKAQLLLNAGADRGVRGRCGKTPIAYAVECDHVDMLRWLLSLGEDIEGTNDGGDTPLIIAADYGATECVRQLIRSGANVFAQNDIPYRAIEQADNPGCDNAWHLSGRRLCPVPLAGQFLGARPAKAPWLGISARTSIGLLDLVVGSASAGSAAEHQN